MQTSNFVLSLEHHEGDAPSPTVWKTVILTVIRMVHKAPGRTRTAIHRVQICSVTITPRGHIKRVLVSPPLGKVLELYINILNEWRRGGHKVHLNRN